MAHGANNLPETYLAIPKFFKFVAVPSLLHWMKLKAAALASRVDFNEESP